MGRIEGELGEVLGVDGVARVAVTAALPSLLTTSRTWRVRPEVIIIGSTCSDVLVWGATASSTWLSAKEPGSSSDATLTAACAGRPGSRRGGGG